MMKYLEKKNFENIFCIIFLITVSIVMVGGVIPPMSKLGFVATLQPIGAITTMSKIGLMLSGWSLVSYSWIKNKVSPNL